MKIAIYISGISGAILLVFRLIGIFMEFPFNDLILLASGVLLGLIFLPCYFIFKHREKMALYERIRKIGEEQKDQDPAKETETKTNIKGTFSSPYRDRKSGLIWGGGNIKGANAQRGTRRSFLK